MEWADFQFQDHTAGDVCVDFHGNLGFLLEKCVCQLFCQNVVAFLLVLCHLLRGHMRFLMRFHIQNNRALPGPALVFRHVILHQYPAYCTGINWVEDCPELKCDNVLSNHSNALLKSVSAA